MKDKLQRLKSPASEIPLIGPTLHVLSLTIVVFFRSRFGYSYIQPISVFVLLAIALSIFTGFAWTSRFENQVWEKYKFFCLFGASSIGLFFWRWLGCWWREFKRTGEHDHFSGKSLLGKDPLIKSCLEPILAFTAGAYLYLQQEQGYFFGLWLMLASAALSIKEYWNGWYASRESSLRSMQILDSEEMTKETKSQISGNIPPVRTTTSPSSRKSLPMKGKPAKVDKTLRRKYARILGLEPPFSFENARRAYNNKVRAAHPDSAALSDDDLPDDRPEFHELREALKFFKSISSK